PGLLFFRRVGEGLLPGGVREQAGDELIGELAEGEVNLGLQQGEGRGVASELLGPGLLLGSEVGADLLEGRVGGGDVGPLWGVKANAHGLSFGGTSGSLPTIATEPVSGSPFWERTPPGCRTSNRRRQPVLIES